MSSRCKEKSLLYLQTDDSILFENDLKATPAKKKL